MAKLIDLTGQRFGRLTVIERAENDKNGCVQWLCRCSCGTEKVILGHSLKSGNTRSCGDFDLHGRFVDLKGQKFGNLTVINRTESDKHGNARWICKCSCGNTISEFARNLKSGYTKSCGCLLLKRPVKHGMSQHRIYKIWRGMKDRCLNPKVPKYKNYGGRGIKICPEWEKSFELFCDWAFQNGYADNLTIDRIDNDGNYSPENCQWLTKSQNSAKKKQDNKKK